MDNSGQSWPSWRTCPANSGSRALWRGKGNGSSGWLRSAFAFPAGRFRTEASETSDWLTRPWNPARSNARPASNSKNAILARRWGLLESLCRPGIILVCLISGTLGERFSVQTPISSHSANDGREALRESLGRATAEYPLSAVLVLLL